MNIVSNLRRTSNKGVKRRGDRRALARERRARTVAPFSLLVPVFGLGAPRISPHVAGIGAARGLRGETGAG
jgi:hypothetical protein